MPVTELPDEIPTLTVGMYGKMGFYDIKGVVEHLMIVLGIGDRAEYTVETELSWMHPGRTASVIIDGVNVGYLGELHPTVARTITSAQKYIWQC